MSDVEIKYWKKCSSCKNPILFNSKYYVCSVSTCNGQRTGYVFCSVPCFERHLPGARHKDAAAIESVSERGQQRIIPKAAQTQTASLHKNKMIEREVLVIASRLKDYIAKRSEYNTSASVMDVLSDHIRDVADRAIDKARAEGRKTVLDRDFQFLKNLK